MNENKEFASDIKVGHKEIEEIAKLIDDRLIEARNWLGSMNRGEGYWIATALHNAGYRNCKDKVVLTRAEYNDLKGLEERFDDYLIKEIKETRKETAREIFAKLQGIGKLHTEFDWNDYLEIDVDDFYKLAKQYGVEVEE